MAQKQEKRTEEEVELSYKLKLLLEEIMASAKQGSTGLATKSGVSKRQILRILRGEGNPTFYTICALAKALDINPFELLYFDRNQKVKRNLKYPFKPIHD